MGSRATTTPKMAGTASVYSSLAVNLIVALSFGVIVPSLPFVTGLDGGRLVYPSPGMNALLGSAIATLVAVVVIRRFSDFPGTTIFHYVMPVYGASYGVVILTVLILRMDYSNSVLSATFFASLAIQYVLLTLNQRWGGSSFYAVPGGRIEEFRFPDNLLVERLAEPCVPTGRSRIIVADLHHDHDPAWEKALAQAALHNVPVFHYKQVWETMTGRVQIAHMSENSFGSLLPSMSYRHIKRVLDLLLCMIVIPFLVLPMLCVALIVRLDSAGPSLFFQERMGHRGMPFRMIKYRTMRISDTSGELCERTLATTRDNDDRITRIGHFLRHLRIDELPQIVNILRGEMSWIGPRPEALALSDWYEAELPFYSYRHIVRPGITGWAQVNQGHVTNLGDVDAKLQYDFFYIKNFSYWLDTLIVLRTIRVMLTGFGAR